MLKGWPAILTLGWILLALSIAAAGVALYSLVSHDGLSPLFAEVAAITAGVGGTCVLSTVGRTFELRFRDATLLTVLAWFAVPAFIALPYLADPLDLSLADAYFEAVSGLTTTGATVLTGLDDLPHSLLLWRSLSQWIGGMGIIGFAILILPFLKIGGMQLFRLEFSDRSDKRLPRARSIALVVAEIYVGLTVLCFLAYRLLGMDAFDALNHALTTLPTGGFSTHDSSFGYFDSALLQWASVLFMILASLPFLAYFRFIQRGALRDRIDPQVEAFLLTIVAATVLFSAWLVTSQALGVGEALTESTFNIVSIVTTTGYASLDYLGWGTFAAVWFFILTFVGGCTGSTAGGLKIFRFQMASRIVGRHISHTIHPHAVLPLRYGGRLVSDEQVGSITVFVALYLATIAVISVMLAILGLDSATALSAAATAVGNVGPGVGSVIGPAGTFASLPEAAKVILSVAMVMGRLEILSVLLLMVPAFYR
ncbi:TrkH family potassium uptake protein [Bauldia litoralis]|uniref:TrkH family potassium uptake protein n=1 Tax=Bauldia litoralis TaxID=665467 RepID=UPI003266EE82